MNAKFRISYMIDEHRAAKEESEGREHSDNHRGVDGHELVEPTHPPAVEPAGEDENTLPEIFVEEQAGWETMPLPPLQEGQLPSEGTLPLPPLPQETLLSPASVGAEPEPHILCARRSHAGATRHRNQDSCITFVSQTGGHDILPPFGLFIVADGMGGHTDGDVAGRIVSRTVADHLFRSIYLPLLQGNPLASQRPIPEVMQEAASQANLALHHFEPDKVMGTTLTAALILGRRLYMTHVGDSRAYLMRENHLELITTDHSVVKALEEAGQITAEEAAIHPNRNLLYRALMGEEIDVDSFSILLPRSGRLVVCSDGLWGLVPAEEMEQVLNNPSLTLQDKADQLVQMALDAGGHDNITVVLVDFAL